MERSEWDDLDRKLDEAIRSYSNAEPSPGLESRILRSVEARPSLPLFAWPRLYLAGMACLCVWLVFAVVTHRQLNKRAPAAPKSHSNVQEARNAPLSVPPKAPAEARVEAADQPRRTGAHTRRPTAVESKIMPKRETFPSPTPLAAEERAMRDLTADKYAKVVREFVEFSNKNREPLQIANIVIKPLDASESK